ncbi:MAG TPA: acyltransferase [Aquabacterium sp.]|uniref:acyltransferase n=1 Tax=Aquabacterium sp. TaxID=1872578 RepID=UPI002E368B44|nr:acyltransferase [Aquabacterium sp.]HEX5372681.1 acyltransferase [Aquabacterium sp.]
MSNPVISAVKACFATVVLLTNIVIAFSMVMPLALIKLVLPFKPVRVVVDYVLSKIAEGWIGVNNFWIRTVNRGPWHVTGADSFRYKGWYLVSSNHQSWVDILVLQRVFNQRIPLLKFFIKHELIYVPLMGLAWWALDFPFMRRKGGASMAKDLETARKACEKFRLIPTSVISFMEGTRFTQAKHDQQKSPFQYLLKPKVGGIAMALETMGDQFDCMIDVTIVYPRGVPTFGDLLKGRVLDVQVQVREVKIPKELTSTDEASNPQYRATLQAWINELWAQKDRDIATLRQRGIQG